MKKSFTLLEVLISTVILAFVFVAISSVITSLKRTQSTLASRLDDKKEYLIKTLYYDLANASEINITKTDNPETDELFLITKNSLYKIPMPYVKWIVRGGDLIRAESVDDFNETEIFTIDKFAKNVKIFKIYKNNNKYLIFINREFFEFKGRE